MAAYQLFDKNNNPIAFNDLQQRAAWYVQGFKREQVFVNRFGPALELQLNPKKEIDLTVPDLLYKGNLADLKCQETPFFFANRFGIDPTFAVTFNLKDALSYGKWGHGFENFTVFYWVD
jgi:hypothetical protein